MLFSRLEANSKTDKNADRIVSDIKDAKTSYLKLWKKQSWRSLNCSAAHDLYKEKIAG